MANEIGAELKAWAPQLRSEVLDRARGLSGDDAPRFMEEAFADWAIGVLAEAGAANEGPVCYFEKKYRTSTARAHGYAVSENEDVLDLFVVHLTGSEEPAEVDRKAIDAATLHAVNVMRGATSGAFDRVEEAHDIWDMVSRIKEVAAKLERIRIFVVTDGISVGHRKGAKAQRVKGFEKLEVHIWDLERFFRLGGAGRTRESIEVDLVADFGKGVPCLSVPVDSKDYEAYLAVVPGTFVHHLYDAYGERLLELNVRSFLQVRGKINKGIRETIKTQPEMFFAYNNGITATAEEVRVEERQGRTEIVFLRGLQIVNGGQTTASIHRAATKDNADVSRINVQMKLSVPKPAFVERMVEAVSHYANSQNSVSAADFSANDPYHQDLERLSRQTWAPGEQSKWFYERARGAYQVARAKEGTTKAQLARFDAVHPLAQLITKTDVAVTEHCWAGLPHIVSRGAQKNFLEFTVRRKDSKDVVDERAFKDLVSKTIIFRAIQRIAKEAKIAAYKANVVAFTMSWIVAKVGGQIDLGLIWKEQRPSLPLSMLARELVPLMAEAIQRTAAGRNVTESCKKEDCWRTIADIAFDVRLDEMRKLPMVVGGPASTQRLDTAARIIFKDLRQATSVKEALLMADPTLAAPGCTICGGRDTALDVTADGVKIRCRACQKHSFIDAGFLQGVADGLRVSCYLCKKGNLESQRVSYGVRLRCRDCDTNNSWWKVDERLRRGEL